MIYPIFQNEQNLLELLHEQEGFKLSLFSSQKSPKKLNAWEKHIKSLDEVSELKKYFDTVEELKEYIELKQNLKLKENKCEVYSKHPFNFGQLLQIGKICLDNKQQMERRDFEYINKLCMSNRQLQHNEIKSILLRVSKQLQFISDNRAAKDSYKLSSEHEVKDNQRLQEESIEMVELVKNETEGEKKGEQESEIQILSKVFKKKIELLSGQVEKNRQIMIERLFEIQERMENKMIHVRENWGALKNRILEIQEQVNKSQMVKRDSFQVKEPTNIVYSERERINAQYLMQITKTNQLRRGTKLTKIIQLDPGSEGHNIIAKIVKIHWDSRKDNKLFLVLGDETGIVNMLLYKIPPIKQGDTILLYNCSASVVQSRICIKMEKTKGQIYHYTPPLNKFIRTDNNISAKEWVPIEQ